MSLLTLYEYTTFSGLIIKYLETILNPNKLVGLLVGLNGVSTSMGYLMPEPFYTYIIYMICKRIFLGW